VAALVRLFGAVAGPTSERRRHVTGAPEPPGVLVRELPLLQAETVAPHVSLQESARVMLRTRTPAVLIEGSGSILTEHDLVRALARGDSPQAAAVAVASPQPLAIDAEATVLEAVDTMLAHRFRVLVVLDGRGESIGFVTLLDAASALLERAEIPTWLSGLCFALRVEMTGG
jgi:CBS domain-containing protein